MNAISSECLVYKLALSSLKLNCYFFSNYLLIDSIIEHDSQLIFFWRQSMVVLASDEILATHRYFITYDFGQYLGRQNYSEPS